MVTSTFCLLNFQLTHLTNTQYFTFTDIAYIYSNIKIKSTIIHQHLVIMILNLSSFKLISNGRILK